MLPVTILLAYTAVGKLESVAIACLYNMGNCVVLLALIRHTSILPEDLVSHFTPRDFFHVVGVKYNVQPMVNFCASNGKGRSSDYMTGHFVRAFRASTLICVRYTPYLTRRSPLWR